MNIEVIRFGSPDDKPPLLFIHGSYCGAWVWEQHFLPTFAEKGWWGAAISLRGHGKSDGLDKINSFGLNDYLDDIKKGDALFETRPVLIGHSLGGYLLQKYALENDVRGMVLLSAPSLLGLSRPASHIVLRAPELAMQLCAMAIAGPSGVDPNVMNRSLFNKPLPPEEMAAYIPLFHQESTRCMLEASWPDLRMPSHKPPTLVLGGDSDAFVPVDDYRHAANLWNAELKVMPGVAHGVMMDRSWQDVAREIMDWLTRSAPKLGFHPG